MRFTFQFTQRFLSRIGAPLLMLCTVFLSSQAANPPKDKVDGRQGFDPAIMALDPIALSLPEAAPGPRIARETIESAPLLGGIEAPLYGEFTPYAEYRYDASGRPLEERRWEASSTVQDGGKDAGKEKAGATVTPEPRVRRFSWDGSGRLGSLSIRDAGREGEILYRFTYGAAGLEASSFFSEGQEEASARFDDSTEGLSGSYFDASGSIVHVLSALASPSGFDSFILYDREGAEELSRRASFEAHGKPSLLSGYGIAIPGPAALDILLGELEIGPEGGDGSGEAVARWEYLYGREGSILVLQAFDAAGLELLRIRYAYDERGLPSRALAESSEGKAAELLFMHATDRRGIWTERRVYRLLRMGGASGSCAEEGIMAFRRVCTP